MLLRRATLTLLDLDETLQNSTLKERKDLVQTKLKGVGIDVEAKRVLWLKARPAYELLFSNPDGMCHDTAKRFWIDRMDASEDYCDIEEDLGQVSTGVEIVLQMSHNTLTRAE